MIKLIKRYLSCKTPYREKKAMVLWRKSYQARLIARKKVFEHKYKKHTGVK